MLAIQPRNGHLDFLDGWRGIAVILVIIGHFFPSGHINLGTLGVELFFVLSGRLMAEILFVRQTPLKIFFVRRINRVYPALIVFVLAAFLWGNLTEEFLVGPKAVASVFALIYNYVLWIPGLYRTGFYDHLWSLAVEEHSYIFLGILAFLQRKASLPLLPLLFAVSIACFLNGLVSNVVLGHDYFQTYWRTDVHAGAIFVGAGLYLVLGHDGEKREWLFWTSLLTGLVLSLSVFPYPVQFGPATLALAVAVCTLDRAPIAKRVFSEPILRKVGIISFSLYLWQQPFYKLSAHELLSPWLGMTGALACAITSYFLVEKPFRRRLNRLADRFAQQPAAA
ncbi:acyltransferase family protein [Allorhizobium undicola]|uniref:acyltransferase family protein n=1 Tax=Allorhizobium undicola TaxID=78527 RepID=UPI0004856AAB|nr:acyltransferase [Allorhizobium undicola]